MGDDMNMDHIIIGIKEDGKYVNTQYDINLYKVMMENDVLTINKELLFYQSKKDCKFTFQVTEVDSAFSDVYNSKDQSCEDGSYTVDFEIESHDCTFYTCQNSKLRLHYKIHDVLGYDNVKQHLHLKYLWAESGPSEDEGDELYLE